MSDFSILPGLDEAFNVANMLHRISLAKNRLSKQADAIFLLFPYEIDNLSESDNSTTETAL